MAPRRAAKTYLFRWEDSPGLSHHCGVCATPLHSPRALQSCMGKHVEPCHKFHQHLHFIQKSHQCMSCLNTIQMHTERHREILALLHSLKRNDAEFAPTPAGNKKKKSKNGVEGQGGSEWSASSRAPSEVDTTEPNTGKITPSRISACAKNSQEARVLTPLFEDVTGPEDMEKSAGEILWKDIRVRMTRRERKKARKSAVNASRILETELITAANLEFVSEAIYPKTNRNKVGSVATGEENGQAPRKPGLESEDNGEDQGSSKLGIHCQLIQNGGVRLSTPKKELREATRIGKVTKFSRKDSQRSPFTPSDPFRGIDPPIFERLGVQVTDVPYDSKKRQDLIKKLAAIIREDLEAMDREERDAVIRETAFWHFVSKDAKETLTELHKKFSWATGELTKNKSQKMESKHEEEAPAALLGLDRSPVKDVDIVDAGILKTKQRD